MGTMATARRKSGVIAKHHQSLFLMKNQRRNWAIFLCCLSSLALLSPSSVSGWIPQASYHWAASNARIIQSFRSRASAPSLSERPPSSRQERRQQDDHDDDDDSNNPQNALDRIEKEIDQETYRTNLKIAALAKDCARIRNTTAAVQAVRLLRQLSHPDSVAYNSVLKTLAKVSPSKLNSAQLTPQTTFRSLRDEVAKSRVDAAHVAQELLEEMMALHRQQVRANQMWYERLGKGELSDVELERGAPRVRIKANVRSFSTVMDAWSRLGDLESAQKCEALLQKMQQEFEETGDLALQPNIISYNTLLSAFAKIGDQEKCLQILCSMRNEGVNPDVISHNAILQAIARSQEPDAGERAEEYLRESMRMCRLNGRSYTTCMDAWSQVGQPDRAHALLEEMLDQYEQTRDENLAPNVITYSTIIHAYAVSKIPDKAVKAQSLFRDMMARKIKTNTITTNALLNACATSTPSKEVIQMLKGVYQAIVRANQADHFTFGTVLKACTNFFPNGDGSFATQVFQEACRCGQVSEGVVQQLRHAVPSDVYFELVGDDGEVPQEWSRNVREFRRRKRFRSPN